MLIKILRFIYGYVIFEGVCNYPSKFMNIVANDRINVWNVNCKDCFIKAYIKQSDYKFIRKIAHKTGMHVKITKKCGLPFILPRYIKRIGLIIGLILFLVIIYTLSLFVWRVEIGETQVDKEKVETVLYNIGVYPGVFTNSLNSEIIEQKLMQQIDDIAWCAVNINGSVVKVELNKAIKPPEILKTDIVSNLVATKDGQVVRNEVYSGNCVVKEGDVVLKGQMLVNGIVEDDLGGITPKRSIGKVYARVRKTIRHELSLTQEKSTYTGTPITRKKLKFMQFSLPLTLSQIPSQDCDVIIEENKVELFGVTLPISLYNETFIPVEKETITLDIQTASNIAKEQLAQRENEELKDVKILDKSEKNEIIDNKYVIEASYLCEENIAEETVVDINLS